MAIPEILKELELHTGKFPLAAMRAACEQREAITPELLRVMEDVAANGPAYATRQHYMLHTFATYLLAQFRDRRLFRPLLTIVTLPGELPFDLYGDTITEGLPQLLGSVYDGDPAPLQGVIENSAANEYVRSAALDSLLVLERTGQMSRDEVASYFRSLFHGKLERVHSAAWDGLVCACADLPAPELIEEVRTTYADGLVDTFAADLETIEAEMLTPREQKPDWKEKRWTVITDAIDEMEWWASFHPEPEPKPKAKRLPKPVLDAFRPPPTPAVTPAPAPMHRAAPKVGRNDPCPCGSGRKHKKCCLT